MQVSIIGSGVIGCAVALELRRRGVDVTLIDKNGDVGHGSTSASCGIVRRFYSQPGMIAMAHEGACIWDDWSNYLGPIDDDLATFHRPGMLFIPPKLDNSAQGIIDEMQKLGIKASLFNAEEISERFPFLDTGSHFPPKQADDPDFLEPTGRQIEGAVFEEDAGYVVSPGVATQNLRRAGEREGAVFLLNKEVTKITKTDNGRFTLKTKEGDTIESDVVLNAAGPHSSIINKMAGVKLQLETRALRREVHAMANPLFGKAEGEKLPLMGDLDGGFYSRPESGGRDIIVGSTDPQCDDLEWIENPDDFHQGVTELYRERQCLRLMKRFPEVGMGSPRGVAGLYDVTTQDWYPVADRTDMPGYYVCIGTSGSSFKTAPVLGQLMAEMIIAGEGGQDLDQDPLQLKLDRAGVTIDMRFLSRLRGTLQSTSTVIG